MDVLFLKYLKINLERDIQEEEHNSPKISYNSKCTKQVKTHEIYVTTFQIRFSTTKGKLQNTLKIEEKLEIASGKFSILGTVLSVDKDEVILELHRAINLGEYSLSRITNLNNNFILKKLENFIKLNKKVPVSILDSWIQNIKERIEMLYKINILTFKELLEFFYEKSMNKNTKNLDLEINLQLLDDDIICKIAKNINKIMNYEKTLPINYASGTSLKVFDFVDYSLNDCQKLAVLEVFYNKSYKILGPPGTGKTRTIVEIILQLLNKGQKVLVAGPSNVSIDNIIEKFLLSKYYIYHTPIFYRLGSSFKGLTKFNLENQISQMTSFIKKEKNERNFKKNIEKIKKSYKLNLIEESKIVFSTLFSALKENSSFDWVIIDEACQASDVETFLTLIKGKNFILIGDPNQLCPKSTSLFEKLSLKTFLLNLQYRMCKNLICFSNEMFYDNNIKSHKIESIDLINKSPIVFIDTDCSDFNETEDEFSKKNEGEAKMICKVVKYLKMLKLTIGIITPYSSQAILLKSLFDENVEINTVDGFQGREKDFIILSLVRSNESGDYGFLDDYKRLNVAITRSKRGLVVVGNSQNFKRSELFSKFFKFLEKNFVVIDPIEIDEYFKTTV